MKSYFYPLLSFIAGFSLMTIELVSSRVMAPLIGSSVFTWTSLIGITLLGLALGSFVGGKAADKFSSPNILAIAFQLSSFLTFLIPFLSKTSTWVIHSSNSLPFLTFFLSSYLFLLPAVAIGLIQPLIVKKYVSHFSELGKKYGWLSTMWSFGSIVGVFITGFYFISYIGSKETIYIVALLLSLSSLLSLWGAHERKYVIIGYGLSLIIAVTLIFTIVPSNAPPSSLGIVYEKETAYYTAKVVDFNTYPYGPSRALILDFDAHSIESSNTTKPNTYLEVYPFFQNLKDSIQEIGVIGAGAYTLPKNLKEFYPDSHVTVFEIDPALEKISQDYFHLASSSISTRIGDARLLLRNEPDHYDLLFGDAFNSFVSVPGYLLTKEFTEEARATLKPDGIYAVNFIGSIQGKDSEMFKSMYATFSSVFPNNYVLNWSSNLNSIQNIVLIGINGDKHIENNLLIKKLALSSHPLFANNLLRDPQLYKGNHPLILTDNFYPTEKLMNVTVKDYFPAFRGFMDKILPSR